MWSRPTKEALDQLKIGKGWRCLELGCGAGVALEQIARRVGPSGEVLGVDMNPRVIEKTGEALHRSGVHNAGLMVHDVESLGLESGSFDLVYARIFLYHMRNAEAIFQKMVGWVRPGGLVLVQDYDCSVLRHIPPLPCFDRYEDWFRRAVSLCGAHYTIGRDLVKMFTDAGVEGIEARGDVHVSVSGDPYYDIPAEILNNMRSVVLGQGICQEKEFDHTVAELRAASETAGHCLLQPLLISVWGRRPNSS
ncbi:MAG: class I SAM-dependent methyltransferase [Nitrospinota bacterium]